MNSYVYVIVHQCILYLISCICTNNNNNNNNNHNSYLSTAERGPGLVAAEAESQKRKKYSSLGAKYFFVPIACESLGVFGAETLSFLKDLGHRLHKTTGDSQSYQFLLQRLSVAIQRGNSTSVLGTLSSFDGLDDF